MVSVMRLALVTARHGTDELIMDKEQRVLSRKHHSKSPSLNNSIGAPNDDDWTRRASQCHCHPSWNTITIEENPNRAAHLNPLSIQVDQETLGIHQPLRQAMNYLGN